MIDNVSEIIGRGLITGSSLKERMRLGGCQVEKESSHIITFRYESVGGSIVSGWSESVVCVAKVGVVFLSSERETITEGSVENKENIWIVIAFFICRTWQLVNYFAFWKTKSNWCLQSYHVLLYRNK